MKVAIDVPDEEIQTAVQELLVRRLADQIFSERNSLDKRGYQRMLKEAVKDLLTDRVDAVVDRAVVYAADYIGKKGVKKIVATLEEAGGNDD